MVIALTGFMGCGKSTVGVKLAKSLNVPFTDMDAYIEEPSVKQAILARQHAVVYDFLADPFKKENRACTILDCPVSAAEALAIAQFFGAEISAHGQDIEFRYIQEKHYARFILAGAEAQVRALMKAYYER